MVLSWLYAWAAFLMTSIIHRPFPLPEAIGTFLLAATLILVIRGTGMRVISVLGLQILGFLLAASRIVYTFNYQSYPYFGKGWVVELLSRTRDPMEWLILVIIVIIAMFFWLGGVALARKPIAYSTICIRFDYGVIAFFCLFIIKSLLLIKGGIEVKDPVPFLLLFPFFIFSLLAIGLARNRTKEQRNYLAGYKGIGVLVSFTVVVLVFGGGLALLFMPYLGAAAEAGHGVLKSASGPLVPILVRVLRLVFFRGRLAQEPLPSSD
jgi:predicted small integral membrane protein